jgi:hypothetical protein
MTLVAAYLDEKCIPTMIGDEAMTDVDDWFVRYHTKIHKGKNCLLAEYWAAVAFQAYTETNRIEDISIAQTKDVHNLFYDIAEAPLTDTQLEAGVPWYTIGLLCIYYDKFWVPRYTNMNNADWTIISSHTLNPWDTVGGWTGWEIFRALFYHIAATEVVTDEKVMGIYNTVSSRISSVGWNLHIIKLHAPSSEESNIPE